MDKTPFLQYLKQPITVPRWSALLVLGMMETGLVNSIQNAKRHRQECLKLRLTAKRTLDEAWPHLPPEVQDKINEEIQFYNLGADFPASE